MSWAWECIFLNSNSAANYDLRSTGKQVTFTLFYLDSFSVTEEYSDCSRSPCQNGGTCINGRTSFICACRHPFTGDNCTVKVVEENALAPGKKVHASLDLLNVIKTFFELFTNECLDLLNLDSRINSFYFSN